MKQKLFLLFFVAFFSWHANAESLVYVHEGLHLYFTIDTETKEAILGNAFSTKEQNAIAYPPLTDPWWNANPQLNLWRDVVIPSTINCEGTAYTNDGGTCTIDKGTYTVVGVSSNAFYKSQEVVQTVKLPETIREIGSNAFALCIYLRSITLPSQLTAIGEKTFNYCKLLEKIHLPSNVISIGTGAFSDCLGLKEISIPGSCTSIGDDAFMGCSALHKVIIEDGTETLNVGSSFEVSVMYYSVDEDELDLRPHQRGLFGDCNIDTLYLGRNIIYPYGYDWKSTTSSQWTNRMRPFPPFEKCSKYQVGVKNYWYSGYTLKSLEFGETLTDIPDSLFASTEIKCELSLPPSLKRIGKRAFYKEIPSYLEYRQVEIPQSVEYIGEEAFRGNYLYELVLNEGLETIGNYAFYDNKISSLTIPSTVTNYGNYCFGKNEITSLKLTEGLKTMCSISDAKIVELTIPESIESIGGGYGTSLRFVHCNPTTPPDGIIGNNAIIYVPAGTAQAYRAKGWTNVVDYSEAPLSINVKTAGHLYSRILAEDLQLNDVYRLKLKGTLNADDWSTINDMSHLYDLDLSETNLEELPSGFFQNNTKLNKITFPNTLQSIEDEAFVGCVNIGTDISIPASCTTIGNRAFYNLYFAKLVFNGSTNVQEDAFRNCSLLKEVTLASGMEIGTNAFLSTALEELSIPANVIIGNNAFNITTIKNVTFNGGGQEIGDNVFNNSVEKFTFNGTLKSIGSFAPSVETIDVNDISTWCKLPFTNPVSIYKLTINGNDANNIVISDDIKSLREYLFYDCPTIETIQLPDDITEIPNQTFYNCINLSTVNLPTNLEAIGNSAFWGCSSIQEIEMPSKVETLGISSFEGCATLQQISMPSSLTSIGDFAFKGCTLLNNVILSENLVTIGEGAFAECSSIDKLDIPNGVTSIGENVFSGCSSLSLVVAHWKEPIAVNNVSGNCFLYVPIGTSQKYRNAGWNFSNLKEMGVLTVLVTGGGNVEYDSEVVNNKRMDFYFKPYKDFSVNIVPNSGYKIVRAMLNGENIIPDLSDGEYEIEEPEDDIELFVIFADASIEQGDVNADRVLNATDATGIANYILKRAPEQFHDYWADMNGDGIIDITDIIMVISQYMSNQ